MDVDRFGNPVTRSGDAAADAAAGAGVDDFIAGMLGYEQRAANILGAAAAAPGHALANIYAGMLHMLAEAPGAGEQAAPFLARARAAAANRRERMLADGLAAWIADDIDAVIAGLGRLLTEWPRDLLALKILHYHLFNRGAFGPMLEAAEAGAAAAPDVAQVHGMRAFALEQCHRLGEAEAAARRALAMTDREPWAEHALAHVLLTEGRIEEGTAFLEAASPKWVGLNSFMATHLWWHLALFLLARGAVDRALAAYDAQIWGVDPGYSQDQIGAVSMLARLEVAGADVGPRWDDVARHLAARAGDVVQPFLSVQYLYGLARAGRPEADRLLQAIAEKASAAGDPWPVAERLGQGLVAHARGAHALAAATLGPVLPLLERLGGSHAQRDLFEQLWLVSALRAGGGADAVAALRRRLDRDPADAVALRLGAIAPAAG